MTMNAEPTAGRDAFPALNVPTHQMLGDKVYEVLRDALLSHEIAPGARLNLASLSRAMHVSNTPLRQALARLQSDGLVTQEPYRGYRATPLLEEKGIADLYEFRLLVEPAGAAAAAQRHVEDDVEPLRARVRPDTIQHLLDAEDGRAQLAALDAALHVSIAELSGNSVLTECVADLVRQASVYSLYQLRSAAEEAWEEHAAVVSAIVERNARAARVAMASHLANGRDRMRAAVR